MVGVSGSKDRQIELVKDELGNEVVVFGGWENWEQYYQEYIKHGLKPESQWQWKQNYPDLVVEDIIDVFPLLKNKEQDYVRSWLYADLLFRGINKWLFVRYLLVRYKKLVADWRNKYYEKWEEQKEKIANMEMSDVGTIAKEHYTLGYLRGKFEAYRIARADLKTLCCTPRYVVWNGSRPGFIVDRKISRGWLNLVRDLYNIRFER